MTFQTAHLLRKVHCHIYFLEFFEFFEKKYFLDVSPIALTMVSLNDLVSYWKLILWDRKQGIQEKK